MLLLLGKRAEAGFDIRDIVIVNRGECAVKGERCPYEPEA